MHLILDGYGGDPQKLQDLEHIYGLLDSYPSRIGMTKIMPPYVFRYHGVTEQDWGVSGFVLIAESHISIHTFPERAYINVDIFSCKSFEAEKAIENLRNEFRLARIETRLLERGLEYPTSLEEATPIVMEERLELAGRRG
ncbi:MAG: adenosylmethionine decarboxylase proenzyme [Dehalococcoidia bacterium]|nr:adenosylmethionine decarboxylase proenzyme [Dehalococcoidia bacterium]